MPQSSANKSSLGGLGKSNTWPTQSSQVLNPTGRRTVSFGGDEVITTVKYFGATPERLLKQAGTNVYSAKETGSASSYCECQGRCNDTIADGEKYTEYTYYAKDRSGHMRGGHTAYVKQDHSFRVLPLETQPEQNANQKTVAAEESDDDEWMKNDPMLRKLRK